MKYSLTFYSVVLLGLMLSPAHAAEYFVNKSGQDSNPGISRNSAFLTIGKGVQTLKAGDTLTIGKGEYRESILRDKLGSMETSTLIRAEIPGTVLLRGDSPLASKEFQKLPGYRNIYWTPFEDQVQAVSEIDTLSVLKAHPVLGELEYTPGTCHYDAEAKRLYISTSDLQKPEHHKYSVATSADGGLILTNPRKVIVDGLAATGYQNSTAMPDFPHHKQQWGILLARARGCIVRNCTTYLNKAGIGVDSNKGSAGTEDNGWNLIEKCVSYANGSINIIGYASNHDEIRDCLAYRAGSYGMRFYGAGIRGPALMKNNISWGNGVDIMIKGGQADKLGASENSVTLGQLHSANIKNSIVGTFNQYNRSPGKDTIYGAFSDFGNPALLAKQRDLAFVDPENLDFRLQGNSRYRKSGPGGTFSGAYPYQANVFFLSSNGKDSHEGTSSQMPWRTLKHAMARLRSGDTLYLEGGTYLAEGTLTLGDASGPPAAIRARGSSQVIIRGALQVSGTRGLQLERLNFQGPLVLLNSRDILLKNCRFSGTATPVSAKGVTGLEVSHCLFTGFATAALQLQESSRVKLSGNLLDNGGAAHGLALDSAAAIEYSDYNTYSSPPTAWRVAGSDLELSAIQQSQEIYSSHVPAQIAAGSVPPLLENGPEFAGLGPHGTPAGLYLANARTVMRATPPELHSVSDSSANLEWWTSVPANTLVAWGDTPEMTQRKTFNKNADTVTDGFNTLSLTGLKPGTKYYVRLLQTQPLDKDTAQYTLGTDLTFPVITFQTLSAADPGRTLYVATTGNDARDGLTRATAWRTITRAGEAARPGDTVTVLEGTYSETVRVRASGSPDRPIHFTAAAGEKVILDGNNRRLNNAFNIVDKQHISLSNFYFQNFSGGGWKCVVDLRQCQNILVQRCFFNAFGKGSVGTQLRAQGCRDVTLRNSAFIRAFQGMVVQDESTMVIENNVFLNNLICPILSSNGPADSLVVRKNIFVDSIPSKLQAHLFEVGGFERYRFSENAFYLRVPDADRKPFLFYGTGPGRLSVAEYDRRRNQKNYVVTDPQFAASAGKEFKDRTGKVVPFVGDWLPRANLDFPDLFTLHPELKTAGVGLDPAAFADFALRKPVPAAPAPRN